MSENVDTEQQGQRRQQGPDPRLDRALDMSVAELVGVFAGIVGGLSLVVGLLWWLVTKAFGLGPKVLIIVAGVCVIYAVAANYKRIFSAFTGRRAVSGLNTAVFALIITGILVLINIIAVRYQGHYRYDATENKHFSLSDQSREVVRSLDKEIRLVAFVSADHYEYAQLRNRLEQYNVLSPKLKVEFYDPTTRVDAVEEYGVTSDGTVIVKAGGKEEKVISPDEERLTSALLAVTTGEKTRIYFLTGHGELDPEGTGRDSISTITSTLEDQQYEVKTLSMFNKEDPVVASDAAAVVIAGARRPLNDKEMAAIKKYADQGGKLFIALANQPDAPDFSEVLSSRDVVPLSGMVMDPDAQHNAGTPSVPAVLRPEDHEVTERLQGYGIVLPTAGALEVQQSTPPNPRYPQGPPPGSQKAQALLKTSSSAWLDAGERNETKDSGETTGPLVMAAAIDESKKQQPPPRPGMPEPPEQGEAPGTRIVVVGDAQFLTDRLIQGARFWGNAAFALNSINWLLANEKLISIPPKETETPYLTMVGAQKAISAVIVLFVVPGIVLIGGVLVWWTRRR